MLESPRPRKRISLSRRRGANSIEYLIIMGVVTLATLGAFTLFGRSIKKKLYDYMSCKDDNCIPHKARDS